MKSLLLISACVLAIASGCDRRLTSTSAVRTSTVRTLSSFDPPTHDEKSFGAHDVRFEQTDLALVLSLYSDVSHRSIIRAANVPDVKITFSNQTPMQSVELLQALDTVLAAQGIVMVCLGTQYVKAVPTKDAPSEPGPIVELDPAQLPESSSFLTYFVKLRNIAPDMAASAVQPFARLPNSVVCIRAAKRNSSASNASIPQPFDRMLHPKDPSILILRDYSSNVRRMLQVIEKLEQQ